MSVWPGVEPLGDVELRRSATSPASRSRQGRSLWPSKSIPAAWTRRARSETGGSPSSARVVDLGMSISPQIEQRRERMAVPRTVGCRSPRRCYALSTMHVQNLVPTLPRGNADLAAPAASVETAQAPRHSRPTDAGASRTAFPRGSVGTRAQGLATWGSCIGSIVGTTTVENNPSGAPRCLFAQRERPPGASPGGRRGALGSVAP